MQNSKNSEYKNKYNFDMGNAPVIEMLSNRCVTVEGSTGILLYEKQCIKINTLKLIISFTGRNLNVKCVSGSCVEVSGFITAIEFIS